MPTIAEQLRMEGRQEGRQEAILDILETRFISVPKEVRTELEKITNPTWLKQLLKDSCTVKSLEEFTANLLRK